MNDAPPSPTEEPSSLLSDPDDDEDLEEEETMDAALAVPNPVSPEPGSSNWTSPVASPGASLPSGAAPSPRAWNEADGVKGKEMVIDVLQSALDLAKAAVSHDERHSPPEKVLPYYEKAIRAIDTALKLLPEEVTEQTGMRRHREAYRARVDQLRLAAAKDREGPPSARAKSKPHQSRVPFEQLELDPCHAIEAAPEQLARRPYWVMRLVAQTIEQPEGAYVTPRLFVPRGVWAQVGVKFSGFAHKINAMEALLILTLERIMVLPRANDVESRRDALRAFIDFRQQARKIQNDLARPFPFISEVTTSKTAKATVSPKTNLGRLNHMVKNIGRNVKNTAAVAYERIGASVPGKASDDELVYYSQVVCTLCQKCQVFDQWYLHMQKLRGENDRGSVAVPSADMNELLLELCHVGEFMQEVVCEIILRDLENLVERYLKKMRKSFARMVWDEGDGAGWGAGEGAA